MKKITTIILSGLLLVPGSLFAQNKSSFFHIGVIARSHDKEYTNTLSFNLISGSSQNEKAFTFSGIHTSVSNQANGLQFAGISNVIGSGKGVLFGGLVNITGEEYDGLQFAGLANISGDNKGIQFGGLGNVSGYQTGLQFGGLGNVNGGMSGVQFGGLGNITGDGRGVQVGGLGNISGNFEGWQIAGIDNIAGNIIGLQFAGIGNFTGRVRGVQLGGLLNIAQNVNGLQAAGLINIAKEVQGVQFSGLINIADESDYPIGLLNFIKNGEKRIGITYDETGSTILGLRTGGRVLYGILGIGFNHKTTDEKEVMEGGFGIHIPVIHALHIHCELTQQYMNKWINTDSGSSYVTKSSFKLLPTYKIGRRVELLAGPTLNYMMSDNISNQSVFPNKSLWKKYDEKKLKQLYIGYTAGLNYLF